MSDETPLANSPEAGTPTGEIKPAPTLAAETTTTQPTTPESTTTPSDKPAETLAAKEAPKPAEVPEKYEFKVPEGQELPQETVEKITPVFKELGLSNDQAQRMLDLHNDIVKSVLDKPLETYQNMRADWRKDVISDRYIGNGRDGLSQTAQQDISAAFNAMGDQRTIEEFKEAMNLTGAGDHPAFLRAFAALGKHFREGTAVRGSGPAPVGQQRPGQPRSAATALYPNLPSAS